MPRNEKNPLYVELADRLVALATGDARIRALWIEAGTPRELRRPFDRVTVHTVADEPDFPALVEGFEALLAVAGARVEDARWSDTVRCARQLDARITIPGDAPRAGPVTFIIECSAFLAKRPRRAVAPLVDKTCHLTHVMSFVR